MKQTIILVLLLSVSLCFVQGQGKMESGAQDRDGRSYWAGLNYSYSQTDMKLFSRTEHAIWMGLDYGEDTLSEEQISSINSLARFTNENNAVYLEAGMVLFERAETGWYVDGAVLIGVTKTSHEVYDRERGSTDLLVTSSFSRLLAGCEFNVGYSFNDHWGLVARPVFLYSQGSNDNIEDKLDLPINFLVESRKEKSKSVASRLSLMASYHISKFTFSAGPGFYLAYNNRKYTVQRTNPENGSDLFTESHSIYYNHSFVDGSVNIEYSILPELDVNLYAGIGKDILVQAGIRYIFKRTQH